MAALAWALGVSNLLYPQYTSGISSQPPEWRPHGQFELVVSVVGLGMESCGAGVVMLWDASAWSVSASSSGSLSAADGSCTLRWQCGPSCQMIETSSGSTSLRLVSTNQSAASFVSYALQLPSFSADAVSVGSGSAFTLSSSFYAPNTNAQTMGALQGSPATVVSVQLTPYVVSSGSGVMQMVAYQPSLNGVQFGGTISTSTFDFSNPAGFEIDFVLSRNTLSLVKCVLIVLIVVLYGFVD
jgi:hypothetical protein